MNKTLNAVKRRVQQAPASLVTACKVVAAGSTVVAASGAHAAGFTLDTTDIVGVITSGVVAVSAIGTAAISLVVVIHLFKWVRRVL